MERRHSRRWVVGLLMVAVVAASCTDVVPATSTTASAPSSTTTATVTTTLPPETTTTAPSELPPCLSGDQAFTASRTRESFGADAGDAATVAAVRWAGHPGCERVVIDLLTEDGAPASRPGPTTLEFLPDRGIARLSLADPVTRTAIADATFDGELVAGIYVVRAETGSLFVDVHLQAVPTEVRAFDLGPPARIVLDVRPGSADRPAPIPPAVGGNVVVVEPAPGTASYPLSVSGYARTFEANVVARIRTEAGAVPDVERVTTAADWTETWGAFQLVLPSGPTGAVELFVGEDSPRDGSEVGVTITLLLR